jgi:hypothetical protein
MLRGTTLTERTVTDSSILGGPMMGLYEADYSTLGSGDRPWTITSVPGATATVTDEVDVADLESEAAHAYDLAGAEDEWQVLHDGYSPATDTSAPVRTVDGGRAYRKVERFTVHLDGASFGIARVASTALSHATVHVDGRAVAGFDVPPGAWTEQVYTLPRSVGSSRIEIDFDAPVAAFHHWFVGGPEGDAARR